MVINVFGICYMLNVCVLSRYLSPVVEWSLMSLVSVICLMFVCVLLLSQPSSRLIINVFGVCYMLNVCVLSRYLSPVVEWSLMSLVSVIC